MTDLSFSKPVEGASMVVASYGRGLQSTTMLLMAAHGEITPMPDFALEADTMAEGAETEEHGRWMASGNVLPFPIQTVSAGDLGEKVRRSAAGLAAQSVPFWVKNPDGSRGILNRNCTRDFKITPQQREIRRRLGYTRRPIPPGVLVEHWIGFTIDELVRVVPSGKDWDVLRWPLIEKRMTRGDCEAWLRNHDYPVPPKSRCKFCPFTSDERWAAMKAADTDEWREAVEVDRLIRRGMPKVRNDALIHDSLKPLDEADFDTSRGDLFAHVCRGSCGT